MSVQSPIYKFDTCGFDGPLDVLLSLVEKHKLDIYDLQISLLLEQYLAFIKECEERDWVLTADFIEMTARLMYIKSYSLLPPSGDSEEEDPKQELEHMLQEYAKYKALSGELREKYIGSQIFFREAQADDLPRPPANYNYVSDKLQEAYRRVLIKFSSTQPDKGKLGTIVNTSYVPVTVRVTHLIHRFEKTPEVEFENIFDDCSSRSEIIATFLAILELLRCGKLDLLTAEDGAIVLEAIEDTAKEL